MSKWKCNISKHTYYEFLTTDDCVDIITLRAIRLLERMWTKADLGSACGYVEVIHMLILLACPLY